MDNIKEVRYFECTCSKCGKVVQNQRGLIDLRIAGWKDVGDILYCPNCFVPYENLNPQLGDVVRCLIQRKSYRKLEYMKIYQVCELIKDEPGAIYVDLCDGWQARLDRGEYEIIERKRNHE